MWSVGNEREEALISIELHDNANCRGTFMNKKGDQSTRSLTCDELEHEYDNIFQFVCDVKSVIDDMERELSLEAIPELSMKEYQEGVKVFDQKDRDEFVRLVAECREIIDRRK